LLPLPRAHRPPGRGACGAGKVAERDGVSRTRGWPLTVTSCGLRHTALEGEDLYRAMLVVWARTKQRQADEASTRLTYHTITRLQAKIRSTIWS
jgi:hypothetical protein